MFKNINNIFPMVPLLPLETKFYGLIETSDVQPKFIQVQHIIALRLIYLKNNRSLTNTTYKGIRSLKE